MSSLLFAELAATCNALGYSDGSKYFIDPQCQETIKDLIRFLRRDDENHEIRRYLGEAKILQSDLLPILKQYWEKPEIFEIILRLLVNLTNPALLLYREELPVDKTSRNYYLQIIQHLQCYKEAFGEGTVWAILCRKLSEVLQIEWQERGEEKGLIIERILVLVRNVLQVPSDIEAEKRPDNDANIHDQVLWALHQSGMVDILLYIACSENEQQYYMHVLEIVSLMLREQNPALLADAAANRSIVEKERDEKELLIIREKEREQRHQKVKKYTGARFNGTFVLKDVKSISNEDLIYHKPIANLSALDFSHDKAKVKRPKNRLPMKGSNAERRSALSIRLFLKEFCIELLNGAYNTLMYHVKDGLVHAKAQANDESYYLWAMKFFMEFNRHYKFEMKLVSETMSLQAFHYVQTQLETYYEMMVSDKRKFQLWSRRMHIALRAYQELFMTLIAMDKSNEAGVQESARVIKSNIFYVIEYRELILTLMLNYEEIKMSRSHLKDLVETVHVFLKLLQHFCDNSRGIVVQQKQKHKSRKKKKSGTGRSQVNRSVEEIWEDVEPQISTILQNPENIPGGIVPFDSTSEKPIDDQKIDAVTKIQIALREQHFGEALGLLKASREVWPENDCFGNPNPTPEEELTALRDIYLADLGVPLIPSSVPAAEDSEDDENEEEEEDEEAERAARIAFSEQTFQFIDFAKRFVSPRTVQACGILLHQFEKNTAHTNHCALKLLHRISVNCKMPAMLFQATLFRTFQRILQSTYPEHKELKKFAVYIVRQFFKVAQVNSRVYMELLFWKSSRDAYDIENGYGSYQTQTHCAKQVWSEAEENELRRLHEEFLGMTEGVGEGDVVDWIMKNMINKNRSRRGVTKKLKELGYAVATKAARKSVKRPPKEWGSEEVEQLTALYEQFKNACDPLGCIGDHLALRRPKARIVEKLLELGLVKDKKELHKKRSKKTQAGVSDMESSDSESNDSDDSGTPRRKTPKPVQRPKGVSVNKPRKPKQPSKTVQAYSSILASSVLKKVVEANMTEALEWIAEALEETAEDREQDPECSDEGVPLLPLSEAAIVAVDDPLFQQMMRTLGLSAPADEQEIYWRIPPHLYHADLRSRIVTINQAIAGQLSTGEDLEKTVADACKKILSENAKDLEGDLGVRSDSEEESSGVGNSIDTENNHSLVNSSVNPSILDSEEEDVKIKNKDVYNKSKKNRTLNSDSEEENSVIKTTNSEIDRSKIKKGSATRIIVDSSDSEEETPNTVENEMRNTEEEQTLFTGSKKRLINSDSEEETLNVRKSRKVLLSDDED